MNWNILMVNNRYPCVENPQPGSYIKAQKERLEDIGCSVDLLVMDTNFSSSFRKYFNYVKFFFALIFKNYWKYDLIYFNHLPNYFFVIIPQLFFIKTGIIHWHGSEVFAPNSHNGLLNKLTYQIIPKGFYHIVPSQYFKSVVTESVGISPERIFISPSGGVDINQLVPIKEIKSNNQFVVGFASALDTWKGADILLEVAKQIEKIPLEIKIQCIAYGSEKGTYINELKRFGSAVSILEPMPRKEMTSFYNSIDVLLFPTKRKAESLGLVALEAMACGVPVIGPEQFALKEYIIPGMTGEFIQLEDFSSLNEAIVKIASNKKSYKPRQLVITDYSTQIVSEGYIGILNQIFKP